MHKNTKELFVETETRRQKIHFFHVYFSNKRAKRTEGEKRSISASKRFPHLCIFFTSELRQAPETFTEEVNQFK